MNYSIYYMLTARCNLCCGYCFRDASKKALEKELNLDQIKEAIRVLYTRYNVRKITLSGGEPLFLKDSNCESFTSLIDYVKSFKSDNPVDNLRVVLITNVTLLTPEVAEHLKGVVDRVTITVDAFDEDILTRMGRNTPIYKNYIERTFSKMKALSDMGFEIKLHSVVSPINYGSLLELADYVKSRQDIRIVKWKFFQYTGFGKPNVDAIFNIDKDKFLALKPLVEERLKETKIKVGFKSLQDQQDTLFNLLPDGTFEYFITENGTEVRKHSKPLFEYSGWSELFDDCPAINKEMFYGRHKE